MQQPFFRVANLPNQHHVGNTAIITSREERWNGQQAFSGLSRDTFSQLLKSSKGITPNYLMNVVTLDM